MFDFEKLQVYNKAKAFNKEVYKFLQNSNLDNTTKNQLRRASFSIMLNIAEGSGRDSRADKRHFYVMSRGSTFECVAIFDYLKDINTLSEESFIAFYKMLDELSRMLYGLMQTLNKK